MFQITEILKKKFKKNLRHCSLPSASWSTEQQESKIPAQMVAMRTAKQEDVNKFRSKMTFTMKRKKKNANN